MPKKRKDPKILITFRLHEDTIKRLKTINKYHSKVDGFLNSAMDEYFEWLDKRNTKRRATFKRKKEEELQLKNSEPPID